MTTTLQLFPARVRFVDQDGRLTPEAYRALQIVFERVGGATGQNNYNVLMAGVMGMFAADPSEDADLIPGPKGDTGERGAPGPIISFGEDEQSADLIPGPQGRAGKDGAPGPVMMVEGLDGEDGQRGMRGEQGIQGVPGPAIFILQEPETEDIFWPFPAA